MKIYNTLSRKVEEFKPKDPDSVGMYSCGPTVYHFPHIGNLKTYISTDILKRTLFYNGFKVHHVMNITDVGHLVSDADTGEDKVEKSAKKEGKTVWEIADFYTEDFMDSLSRLNILLPNIVCKATDHIKEMILLIQKLVEKKLTYRLEDGIYFDTKKLSDYGKLAKLDIKGLKAGARVEMVEGKKQPTDFALWKFSYPNGKNFDPQADDPLKKRQMEWESPWGLGFPGWHIECSAMSMKYLGDSFDIHSGGVDHIPIHHTNEIAQSEGATGKLFVKYWVHFAHLLVDGEKMSKSLGNFYTKDDILKKGFSLTDLRYLFLQSHYRTTANFTWESLSAAKQAMFRLKTKIKKIVQETQKTKVVQKSPAGQKCSLEFFESINDDLNIPKALGILWQSIDDKTITPEEKYFLVLEFDKILGLELVEKTKEVSIPERVKELLRLREKYRLEKNFQKSDELRAEILKLGYLVKDTKAGVELVDSER